MFSVFCDINGQHDWYCLSNSQKIIRSTTLTSITRRREMSCGKDCVTRRTLCYIQRCNPAVSGVYSLQSMRAATTELN